MAMIVPALAALIASTAAPAVGGASAAGQGANVVRLSGASAVATVSARIIRSAARIGADFGAPYPAMQPRRTTVTAADGAAVPALVYDFE